MKALALIAACAAVAGASPRHKPDRYTTAAAAEFEAATKAEALKKWDEALEHYATAFEISPHPDTAYNVALLHEQLGHDHAAITACELYLALAPDAPDRADVAAAIKRILTRTHALTYGAVSSTMQLDDAYLLIDGDIVSRPGQHHGKEMPIPVSGGRHYAILVSALTFAANEFDTRGINDERRTIGESAPARHDGNVIVMLPYSYSGQIGDVGLTEEGARVTVPAGKRILAIRDEHHECPPVDIDAPADGVLVVQLLETELPNVGSSGTSVARCRKYTVKQQRLVFPR